MVSHRVWRRFFFLSSLEVYCPPSETYIRLPKVTKGPFNVDFFGRELDLGGPAVTTSVGLASGSRTKLIVIFFQYFKINFMENEINWLNIIENAKSHQKLNERNSTQSDKNYR